MFLFSLGKHSIFFVGALRCEHFWLDLKVLLPLQQLRGRSPFLKAKHFVESILLLCCYELSALLAPHVLVPQDFPLDCCIQAEKVSLFALVVLKIALCEDFLVTSFATQIEALAQLSDALSVPDLKFVEALSLFDRLEVQVSLKVKIMILCLLFLFLATFFFAIGTLFFVFCGAQLFGSVEILVIKLVHDFVETQKIVAEEM